MSIKDDFYNSPHLFNLIKVERDFFRKDIFSAPKDLVEFWTDFGAGEIFETETLYSPSTNEDEDQIGDINDFFIEKGMSRNYTVFHTGMVVSAYRTKEPRYVILDKDNFKVIKTFSSFEEWYRSTLRKEYAERYGLLN